jgi:protein PhnA
MSVHSPVIERNSGTCELCNSEPATVAYLVSPKTDEIPANQVALCNTCFSKIDDPAEIFHWRCLEGSIWNPEPAVQALSYRILKSLEKEQWAADAMSAVDIDESVIDWAVSAFNKPEIHVDAFGVPLETGDSVVLTQALNVKGTNFTASKGTVVKRIKLVADNPEHIEGKINEQTIVILTKYVKKQ